MIYHYIYQNQFVTSDEPLDTNEYPIGSDINDYRKGMYVPLNASQVQYENEHPNASPLEVWEMKELSFTEHIKTPQDEMFDYFESEHNLVYINNEPHRCWDHQQLIYDAECALACNEPYFTFFADDKYFKGRTQDVIQILRQIGLYYYKYRMTTNAHYRYLNSHPEEIGTYDYTIGFPEVPNFTLEEVNDSN